MIPLEKIKKTNPKLLLKLIQKAKNYLKKNKTMQEMCQEYNFDIDDIDLIPVKFGDIDVSAKTDRGVITLNWKLLCDGNFFKDIHYLQHEASHYVQQAAKPTQSADDGDYLSNPDEQEAFSYQIKFIDDEFGKDEAEKYVSQVLDHHQETGKERKKKENILMEKIESLTNEFITKLAK